MANPRQFELLKWFARLTISSAFFSAVADRFGLWGPHGAPGIAWGDFQHFLAYTAKVNRFLPGAVIPIIGWVATVAELTCGVGVLIPGRTNRYFALASGVLLLFFAVGMSIGTGVKSALDASVFTASGAGLLLAWVERKSK